MKKGDIIRARTHADFLNDVLDVDYYRWGKCTYKIKSEEDTFMWFIPFDGVKNDYGWTNYIAGDCVVEEYDNPNELFFGEHERTNINVTRLIFNVKKGDWGRREYEFLGVYKFDFKSGTQSRRIWKRVSDEYKF